MKKDISVIIPAINEEGNIGSVINRAKLVIEKLGASYEIIIVDGGSTDNTVLEAYAHGVRVLKQREKGFGAAIKQGVFVSAGDFIVTMDADLSHEPDYIYDMWVNREKADMIIASRYVRGGSADMPWFRYILSAVLNKTFCAVLSLPFKDISSGFRMYKADVFKNMEFTASGFNILEEVIIKFYLEAFEILEVPFHYKPRKKGRSHVHFLKFSFSFAKTLFSMWQLRNSVLSADYDSRAYDSKIPLQRYWQRKRFSIIKNFIGNAENDILDIGCGSSRLIKSLPNAVGLDIKLKVLRHLRKTNARLVQCTIEKLCFKRGCFDQVVISEVIEHIPKPYFKLSDLKEMLSENGIIILGTPDYSSRIWRIIEYFYIKLLPRGYGSEHMSRYTFSELINMLEREGFDIIEYKYICASELIIKAKITKR
ncbi:MAG: bifunctional glycosyltransferase/class I SAM-dependent methyltransferase [Candidatus Omnitrophota bacterium]